MVGACVGYVVRELHANDVARLPTNSSTQVVRSGGERERAGQQVEVVRVREVRVKQDADFHAGIIEKRKSHQRGRLLAGEAPCAAVNNIAHHLDLVVVKQCARDRGHDPSEFFI